MPEEHEFTPQEQEKLVKLGKALGPQIDDFDTELQRLHNEHFAAEHEAAAGNYDGPEED